MKKLIQFITVLALPVLAFTQNKDLPNPVPDIQTLPTGSYIIGMDNTTQVNATGNFNLRSYGLIVYLLNRNIKVKWVISAGKQKDGIDFSVSASKFKPVAEVAAIYDFKAGPFVIFAADTAGVALLIDSFYYDPTGSVPVVSLTGNNRPSVYRSEADVAIDVRYNLYGFKPKAAILTDGGNEKIHVGYMNECSVPDSSWRYSLGTDLLSHCFTFASEPHNDKSGTTAFTTAIQGIRAFVEYGGNFLAQCAAVENYENHITYGRLQTLSGITHQNSHNGNDQFTNNDLSFAQYEGNYHSTQTGHLQSWDINSSWVNNGYMIQNDPGIVGGVDNIGASVSKLKDAGTRGGMVFYLGNHDFANLTHAEDINGIRMYMNAFLTPVTINANCSIGSPLPVSWYSFDVSKLGLDVILQWKTIAEISNKYFYAERSTDGIHFIVIAKIPAGSGGVGIKNYSITDLKPGPGTFYYRIRQEDVDAVVSYSVIRTISFDKGTSSIVNAYPNPSNGIFTIVVEKEYTGNMILIFDRTGQQVYRKDHLNSDVIDINISQLSSGIYTMVFVGGDGSTNFTRKITIIK